MTQTELYPLKKFENEAGGTWRALRSDDEGYKGFGEIYFTWINSGKTKAWKRHKLTTCNLVVPVGEVLFAVETNELRQNFETFILGPRTYQRLLIPPGRWFGFYGLAAQPSLVLNTTDLIHDDEECDNAQTESFTFDWSKK
jgi:dTDP-4-dehydrorhamnose 3,5-epimerase